MKAILVSCIIMLLCIPPSVGALGEKILCVAGTYRVRFTDRISKGKLADFTLVQTGNQVSGKSIEYDPKGRPESPIRQIESGTISGNVAAVKYHHPWATNVFNSHNRTTITFNKDGSRFSFTMRKDSTYTATGTGVLVKRAKCRN